MRLYQYQKDALEKTKDLTHVAYFWEMGTGKTFVGSEKAFRLGNRVILIVCQKSKVEDWTQHIDQYYSESSYMARVFKLCDKRMIEKYLAAIEELRKPMVMDGDEPYLMPSLDPCFYVGVINYDLAWRRPELLKLNDFTLLLDESSLIQNETTKRTRFILRLKAKNVILLSGTPTGGKYERLWSQMHLLGWDIPKPLYWAQYVIVQQHELANGRSIPLVIGYKNVRRLKQKMAEYGCQFLKSNEVFELPIQTFQTVSVPTTKAYTDFRKNCIVKLDGDVTLVGDTILTKMLYERQLCGYYNEHKLQAFEDLINSTDDRVIVFYNFTAELMAMRQRISSRPVSIVNGATKDLKAYEQHSDAITFVQYQAGAMGLNLQKANKIVYFTLPLSSELFEQSKKRIHRIGQDRPCFYYLLICKRSIEEHIRTTLALRRDYTEQLFRQEEEQRCLKR